MTSQPDKRLLSDQWRHVHDDARLVTPAPGRYVVLAPHPDDEVLTTGGLCIRLAQSGAEVIVVGVTDGGNAYPDHVGHDDLAAVRRLEQNTAVNRLGIPDERYISIGLTDGNVSAAENDLVEQLRPLCTPKTTIVAPWEHDHHSDHEAVGRAARRVADLAQCTLWSWLFWAWHHAPIGNLDDVDLVRVDLSLKVRADKAAALDAHASQLNPPSIEPMLTDRRLEPARWPSEYFIVRYPQTGLT